MTRILSTYYPPRARWYRSFFIRAFGFGRPFRGDARARFAASCLAMVCVFLVPGLAFCRRSAGLMSKLVLASCALLVLLFLAQMGRFSGNLAFGLLVSIHAVGLS